MKTAKRFLTALLAALLTLSLASCRRSEKLDIPDVQNGSGDFQKNMHQAQGFGCWFTEICETDDGFYFDYGKLYYLEKATHKAIVVCGKPDCDHKNDSCNALIGSESLWQYGDKLYYITDDYTVKDGKRVEDYGKRVFSVNMDATGRKVVQDLDFEVGGDTSFTVSRPIFHRGYVYFAYSGTLYRAALGADLKDAEVVWSPEPQEQEFWNGVPIASWNAPAYTLWGDGDLMYFMVNTEQPDGVYRDTLFSYDPATKEVRQLWVSPTPDVVGEPEDTGDDRFITLGATADQVDQWYVLNGCIYFFLSGNGMWRCDLATGEYKKLADTTGEAASGTAIFSDEHMWLLNDGPSELSAIREGGDTVYVYGLDGALQKELSLKALTDEVTVHGYFVLFASGDEVYLLADAVIVTEGEDIVQGNLVISGDKKETRNILVCLNADTGEITRITEFDR